MNYKVWTQFAYSIDIHWLHSQNPTKVRALVVVKINKSRLFLVMNVTSAPIYHTSNLAEKIVKFQPRKSSLISTF